MKTFYHYLTAYVHSLSKPVLLLTSLLVALLILVNYSLGLEAGIQSINLFPLRLIAFWLLYTFIFGTAYGIRFSFSNNSKFPRPRFLFLLLLVTFIFALKISLPSIGLLTQSQTPPWNRAIPLLLDWPIRSGLTILLSILAWKLFGYSNPIAGMTRRNLNLKPYCWLLLAMVPLLWLASTQPDFQHTYPKLQRLFFLQHEIAQPWPWYLLYELAYGSDFLSIELFFRGLLVLAFVKYAGKDAILPMAAFYCSIHFGKPLFECISSYFGGILLGVLVYRTASIWGGLLTHLGIAWLMELSGWFGALRG